MLATLLSSNIANLCNQIGRIELYVQGTMASHSNLADRPMKKEENVQSSALEKYLKTSRGRA
jgi:hypothetical protein